VIDSQEYHMEKEKALLAGKKVHNKKFVETLAVLIETSKEISGGRAAEMMVSITYFFRCRGICEKHGLMREVLDI